MLRLEILGYICNRVAATMADKVFIKSDQAGIASAILCTVHCLVVPVLFLLKFSFSDNTSYHLPVWWEKMDYVFLLVSFLAVYHSAKHTSTREIRISLWFFWAVLAAAIIFQAQLHWMAYIASAGLVATHFVNIRQMKKRSKAEVATNNKSSIQ